MICSVTPTIARQDGLRQLTLLETLFLTMPGVHFLSLFVAALTRTTLLTWAGRLPAGQGPTLVLFPYLAEAPEGLLF